MPNVTSYSGSWILWYAERKSDSSEEREVLPPEPLRKVDPIYDNSAVADRIEGKVQLSAIIHTDGYVYGINVVKGVDPRLDKTATEALRKWEFSSARRDGNSGGCRYRDRDSLPPPAPEMNLHLILDADDTLWENNIYFEDAFDEFTREFSSLTSPGCSLMKSARRSMTISSWQTPWIHGYGSKNSGRNLRQCYEHPSELQVRDGDLDTVMSFAERIIECPMQVLGGVEETLAYLAPRHELSLFTKGHPDEQKLKIDRSGLGAYFAHTAIVKEKDSAAYRKLVEERGFDPQRSWMIGNSPKSDINPALECGLNAVFVPHARTWGLEREEIRPGSGKLIVVERFSDLRNHF